MKQYSFLTESKKHLMKILSRYTPEQSKRITSKLVSIGKENGGLYSPSEYGRRMYNGQRKRMQTIAKRNGISLVINDSIKDPIQSGTIVRNNTAQINIPTLSSKSTILDDDLIELVSSKQFKTNKNYRKKNQKF